MSSCDPGMRNLQKILRKRSKPLPVLHGENGIVYTMQEKAEAFADCLERQCRLYSHPDEDDDFVEEVERRARRAARTASAAEQANMMTASPGEIRDIIWSLKTRKAPWSCWRGR
nr:unnamed protein product [Callosobruchus chinensis]